LAFVALPLYVILPNHYAREFGVPLATLGAVLLGARLFDAFIDPLIGRAWSTGCLRALPHAVLAVAVRRLPVLAFGFALLFFPPVTTRAGRAGAVGHAGAGADVCGLQRAQRRAPVLGRHAGRRRSAAQPHRGSWREGLGLVGVLLASVLPLAIGLPWTAGRVQRGCWRWRGWAWTRARAPQPRTDRHPASLWLPFSQQPAFRRLLAVFVLNGIASAVPATLVLFFVQDRLQAPRQHRAGVSGQLFPVCGAVHPAVAAR
jgi:GPH family glycoside/pentoside/hexuronide:cation symporter